MHRARTHMHGKGSSHSGVNRIHQHSCAPALCMSDTHPHRWAEFTLHRNNLWVTAHGVTTSTTSGPIMVLTVLLGQSSHRVRRRHCRTVLLSHLSRLCETLQCWRCASDTSVRTKPLDFRLLFATYLCCDFPHVSFWQKHRVSSECDTRQIRTLLFVKMYAREVDKVVMLFLC